VTGGLLGKENENPIEKHSAIKLRCVCVYIYIYIYIYIYYFNDFELGQKGEAK